MRCNSHAQTVCEFCCKLFAKSKGSKTNRWEEYFKKMINKENRAVEAKGGEKAGSNRK